MMFIALFTGINVDKAKRIKMPELCAIFSGLGFSDGKSYVQSGNIVFRASGMSRAEAHASSWRHFQGRRLHLDSDGAKGEQWPHLPPIPIPASRG